MKQPLEVVKAHLSNLIARNLEKQKTQRDAHLIYQTNQDNSDAEMTGEPQFWSDFEQYKKLPQKEKDDFKQKLESQLSEISQKDSFPDKGFDLQWVNKSKLIETIGQLKLIQKYEYLLAI